MDKGKKHIDQQTTGIGTCTPIPSPCSSFSSSSDLSKQVSATNRSEDVGASGFFSPSVFGNVPSVSEVEFAISVLRIFIQAVTSRGPESNWLVQMLDGPTSRILMDCGLRRVYEAFQLLEIDPSVKRVVVALATDGALWNAILKNALVQKLREPLCSAESGSQLRTIEEPELAATLLQWIWEMSKTKVMELIEQFQALMNETFQGREIKKGNTIKNEDQLEDKVRSSLLLTVVILLIVGIARSNRV